MIRIAIEEAAPGNRSPRGARWLLITCLLCAYATAYGAFGETLGSFEPENVVELYDENVVLPSISGASDASGAALLAQGQSEAPASAEELFGLDEKPQGEAAAEPETVGELFGEPQETEGAGVWSGRFSGFYQNSLAWTYPSPGHWSKWRNTLDLSTDGRLSESLSWKAGVRLMYDPIYDLTTFYSEKVQSDQRAYARVMETYLDAGLGDWDLRLGRQHIIWGEVVGGLFFADVVSGLDLREFIVQEYELIRIPQWAARAEYFAGDFYADLIWIPVTTVNESGVPGAEFFAFPPPPPPGFEQVFLAEPDIANSLDNSGGGARASYLKSGWDSSVFYYTSLDRTPAYRRSTTTVSTPAPTPAFVFQPVHERIHQVGATTAKDFGRFVFKGEAIYTMDREFNTLDPTDPDGLVSQDVLQYILGANFAFREETTFNMQFFQFWFPDHERGIVPDELESGATLFLSTRRLHPDLEPSLLYIRSLNDDDWLLRARLRWDLGDNLRAVLGWDVFDGPPSGLFGQFSDNDRIYYELRYTF